MGLRVSCRARITGVYNSSGNNRWLYCTLATQRREWAWSGDCSTRERLLGLCWGERAVIQPSHRSRREMKLRSKSGWLVHIVAGLVGVGSGTRISGKLWSVFLARSFAVGSRWFVTDSRRRWWCRFQLQFAVERTRAHGGVCLGAIFRP